MLLIQETEELLLRMEHNKEYGLKFNHKKSKIMIVDRGNILDHKSTNVAGCDVVDSFISGSINSRKRQYRTRTPYITWPNRNVAANKNMAREEYH